MNVLITGTSSGIGKATAELFLNRGHIVTGIDIKASSIHHSCYTHFVADVRDRQSLPTVQGVEVLINNAGTQLDCDAISVNLEGIINCTEKYGLQSCIQAIVNVASVSGHNGAEFPRYCASKGGVLAYTKRIAQEVAKYGATCNSISPGGVITDINSHVMDSPELWNKVMHETPLKRWATAQEIAEWIYFIAVTNMSMTGQDVIVDNGEMNNYNFIW